ncbi:hypothetical protein ACJX0J_037471, partial [Zea mays]
PSQGVITHSHKHASFIEHHSFVSCVEPTCIDEAFIKWINITKYTKDLLKRFNMEKPDIITSRGYHLLGRSLQNSVAFSRKGTFVVSEDQLIKPAFKFHLNLKMGLSNLRVKNFLVLKISFTMQLLLWQNILKNMREYLGFGLVQN